MEKKLIEWFNKTGYPFELWTESVLSKYGFVTESSSLYQDEESKIFREIDLIAERSWESSDGKTSFTIQLIIECKKSESPFVLLTNKKQPDCRIEFMEYYGILDPISRMLVNNPYNFLALPKENAYGFKLVQGYVKGDETSHKAINALIKSFNYKIKSENDCMNYRIEENNHIVTIPLLLIDSPFFQLKLDDNNELALEKIHSGLLSVLSHLSKHYPENFPIPVITKDGFEFFLKTLNVSGQENLGWLIENPLCNIKNYNDTTAVFVKK